MWDDIKKISGLVFDQSKEQKDIMLLKLRVISYNSKRDGAFTRLGNLIFKAYKENKSTVMKNEQILKQIEELVTTEKEMAKVNKEMEALIAKTATGRKSMTESLGEAWGKTKSGISALSQTENEPQKKADDKKEAKAKDKPPAKKSVSKPSSPSSKQGKQTSK